jgi:hypothetical protein
MRIRLHGTTWEHLTNIRKVFPEGTFFFSTSLGDEVMSNGTRKDTEAEILRRWPETKDCDITYLEVHG